MNIVIIGNNYFGPILTKQLSEYDTVNSYIFYDTNSKIIDKIKFILNIFKIDVVYSLSASVSGGGALNLALKSNKKIVQHFIGSDVLGAVEDYKRGNINQQLIKNSTFLCEVDWIAKELKEIDIYAKIQTYCIIENSDRCELPKSFSILTYLGKGKEEFYGVNTLIELANKLKDIEFRVAGIDTYSVVLPKNITLLGWVDMRKELQNSVCYIRNASHDGLAFSVVEALSLGRYVFRNYKFPYTMYFENLTELADKIAQKKRLFDDSKLQIHTEAIDFVKSKFNKEKVLGNLVKVLTESKK
ncbi:hypothetical protein [Sulfurimonas sp.]|uniref:hypothetical protein n=1 Tax=Sulfurimonas sp. TaxID=2022749 RepID=UPI00261C7CDB|nr:hypothetical protein [Sulfurimonas sp.]